MLQKANWPRWPTALVEEVGALVSHWSSARTRVLWPTAPQWLDRYWVEMLSAHTHSLVNKPRGI